MSASVLKSGVAKALEPCPEWPEEALHAAYSYVKDQLSHIWTRSPDDYILSNEEALNNMDRTKSPGYPYYYKYQNKGEVIDQMGEEVAILSDRILSGEEIPCVFTMTEKSELRLKEKVEQGKTRVFMASDMHHLCASTRLYDIQNEQLMWKRDSHPITLGISMPGPEFVYRMLHLGDDSNDGDLSGCDYRYALIIARMVQNLRHAFLPEWTRKGGEILYSAIYCGVAVVMGALYRIYGNKSGCLTTAHDNSLMTWLGLCCANFALYNNVSLERAFLTLINGDDLAYKARVGSFKEVCDWLKQYNLVIEADDWTPRPVSQIVFLSHHVRLRHVHGFGDFYVSAGNLPKLLSSINWTKVSDHLSFEESCVAHLLGLRLCLFPWAYEFERVDKILSDYLDSVVVTPFIKEVLPARLTERQMAVLHTRVEGLHFSQNMVCMETDECDDSAAIRCLNILAEFDDSLIKVGLGQTHLWQHKSQQQSDLKQQRLLENA